MAAVLRRDGQDVVDGEWGRPAGGGHRTRNRFWSGENDLEAKEGLCAEETGDYGWDRGQGASRSLVLVCSSAFLQQEFGFVLPAAGTGPALALALAHPGCSASTNASWGKPREQHPAAGLLGTCWCGSIARTQPGPVLGTAPRGQDPLAHTAARSTGLGLALG